jgi:hypothetical protein
MLSTHKNTSQEASAIKADDAKPSPEIEAEVELSRLMARFPQLVNTIWWFEWSGFCSIPGKPSCCATYLAPALQWVSVIYAHMYYPLRTLYIDNINNQPSWSLHNNNNNHEAATNDYDFNKKMLIAWIVMELACCFCYMALILWSRSMAWNILVHVLKFFENKDDADGIVGSRLKHLGSSMVYISVLLLACLIVQLYYIHYLIQSAISNYNSSHLFTYVEINIASLVQLLVLVFCWAIMVMYLIVSSSFENLMSSILEDCKDPELTIFRTEINLADEI